MSEATTLLLCGVAGSALGAIFFGGLWWTIRKGLTSPAPALWFFASLLMRMSIALAGFYFVFDGEWKRLLACLLGFLIARLIITRLAKSREEHRREPPPKASHAP